MAEPEVAAAASRPRLALPPEILIDPTEPLRFSPKELRELRAQTGIDFAALMQREAPVVLAWFKLRREGWPDLRYAELESCTFVLGGELEPADPLSGQPPTGWPDSVGTGG